MTRLALTVHGVVQGVGFRPFVRRAAVARGLTGWVQNGRDGVRIEVQGSDEQLAGFLEALQHDLPAPASIDWFERCAIPDVAEHEFTIVGSSADAPARAVLPADLAPCDACLAELWDPGSRRHRYPFINCTACGPRYAIAEKLPYDRDNTTMRHFAMCEACLAEYRDLDDRRYHAQPIACARCGPDIELVSADGERLARSDRALLEAAERLAEGQVLALRGLGGYQLLVDARADAAVMRLRTRKQRPDKPFAVMFGSLDDLAASAHVSDNEARVLASPRAPIVLLRRRADDPLVPAIHRRSPWIGAMLPTTPLHHLLLRAVGGPVVCTSGNLQDEPICTEPEDAHERLGAIADVFLHHDRGIARPIDDSVVQVASQGVRVQRRARGHVPLPIARIPTTRTVLGLGAHLASTVALGHGGLLLASQHLGDLDSSRARDLHAHTVRDLCAFYGARPEVVACDLHPDYGSTRLAEYLARELHLPLVRVQHHHAHIAAVMAEHELDTEVLGLAWDGTGYGADGTIWGGEALLCRGASFRRAGCLAGFHVPGGDAAMRSPRRAALGWLASAGGDQLERARSWFEPTEWRVAVRALERGINSPLCSSVGRLFDAMAGLLELVQESSYEAQAALAVEACAMGWQEPVEPYPLPLEEAAGGTAIGLLTPLLESVLHDLERGVERACVARAFHATLIEYGVAMARHVGAERVVLAGGCFANRLLADGLQARLEDLGFHVFLGREVPPGDNSVAMGQVWVAANQLRERGDGHVSRHPR